MHEPPAVYGETPPPAPPRTTPPPPRTAPPPAVAGPGPFARLVALVITVGLAWAIVVAIGAWLIGLLISRG